jgi:3-deoxy-D-manno-octulosonate 8-phosphate phosphatase (KDO 8-P phosphatase)
MKETENLYTQLGGRFVTPVAEIQAKLKVIKAFVFDWDGVFNNGQKAANGSSTFSEIDSMGTNLLRYSYFLKHEAMPITAVISGEKNEAAFYFCERESFNYSFFKVANKSEALKFLCKKEKIQPENVAYFFDDVLDIPIAEACGLRLMVNQKANPLFVDYCIRHKLADYLTASPGGQYAVREATELLIGLNGNFDAVINNRKDYSASYKTYITQRKEATTEFFTLKENGIEAT